jgi:hypothetical protein
MAGALEGGVSGGRIEGQWLATGQLVAPGRRLASPAENLRILEAVVPVAAQRVDVKTRGTRAAVDQALLLRFPFEDLMPALQICHEPGACLTCPATTVAAALHISGLYSSHDRC